MGMGKIVLIICILFVACSKDTTIIPERHPGIPQDAVWAGGSDGGAWISCKRSQNKDKVLCVTYFDHDGSVWSEGQYFFKKSSWNKEKEEPVYSAPAVGFKSLTYTGYDGEFIYLSDSHVLIPDGIVVFPLNEKRGSKIYYRMGKELKIEEYRTKD